MFLLRGHSLPTRMKILPGHWANINNQIIFNVLSWYTLNASQVDKYSGKRLHDFIDRYSHIFAALFNRMLLLVWYYVNHTFSLQYEITRYITMFIIKHEFNWQMFVPLTFVYNVLHAILHVSVIHFLRG